MWCFISSPGRLRTSLPGFDYDLSAKRLQQLLRGAVPVLLTNRPLNGLTNRPSSCKLTYSARCLAGNEGVTLHYRYLGIHSPILY